MKIWKTLSGILSLSAAAFIALLFLFTDLLELLANPLQIETFGSPGVAGAIVAAALACGGIITLATRDGGRGGSIAASILYGVGGVVGMVLAGDHLDLRVCAAWSLLCMVVAMVDIGTTEPIHEEDLEAYEEQQRRADPEPPPAAPARSAPAPAPARAVLRVVERLARRVEHAEGQLIGGALGRALHVRRVGYLVAPFRHRSPSAPPRTPAQARR